MSLAERGLDLLSPFNMVLKHQTNETKTKCKLLVLSY